MRTRLSFPPFHISEVSRSRDRDLLVECKNTVAYIVASVM